MDFLHVSLSFQTRERNDLENLMNFNISIAQDLHIPACDHDLSGYGFSA